MTYSVLIRDPVTGDLGVAVQSHFFAVGAVVPWAEAGVGAVATQFVPDPRYGARGLDAMRAGTSAADTLQALLAVDSRPQWRQIAMLDARGNVAVHSGARCIPAAGGRTGDGWSVQGNLLDSEHVLDAMAATVADSAANPALPHRLLAALQAAEDGGGDVRGSQSAAMLVVSGARRPPPDNEVLVNLRVDDSHNPVGELDRLLGVHEATTKLGAAVGLIVSGDQNASAALLDDALADAHQSASALGPDNPEIHLWRAVLLARGGRLDEAHAEFRAMVNCRPQLHDMGARLAAAGIVSEATARALAHSPKVTRRVVGDSTSRY
ncbi:DUF1028 domain-containing protein [Mycobacterium branderi]|uniref:DUF1028 domain-containing protein n=1 Tax=Mycobacterium branderi TaxID=43348 RepID=A0A7I7WH23_9MYCO|nr:DUF1028 domain-containing protein [Mycobacterium branderi]MCV7236343.1 DUF1028 domain-containing protein [Mycobacterium branderi]ORA35507.1 hypothetical protein BST20_18165 [Mycobacterium branderi]BBZ15228.1 hypothetical protein MBRA_54230 [Mycobacterium branderi]